jgi:NAD(P)-dependent dehydrogenase (short-subunit alcohol dehydrogenase family)
MSGCSSGIGAATAQLLLHSGYTVYATARHPDSLGSLVEQGARTLALDVTEEASMAAAVAEVEAEAGSVGVLINNAGIGLYSTVEELDLAKLRTLYETNVFGAIRLTQLVLPGMRRTGRGRIVMVSSVAAHVSVPMLSAYTSSKHALAALSDALRVETERFGIETVCVEPSAVRSRFIQNTMGLSEDRPEPASPYQQPSALRRRLLAGLFGVPVVSARPETVAATVLRAVQADHPRIRYRPTLGAYASVLVSRLLPARVRDLAMRAVTGL